MNGYEAMKLARTGVRVSRILWRERPRTFSPNPHPSDNEYQWIIGLTIPALGGDPNASEKKLPVMNGGTDPLTLLNPTAFLRVRSDSSELVATPIPFFDIEEIMSEDWEEFDVKLWVKELPPERPHHLIFPPPWGEGRKTSADYLKSPQQILDERGELRTVVVSEEALKVQ